MIESGFYASGTEFDETSPWRQIENPEEEFDVTIVETLSKDVTVFTSNYNLKVGCDEDSGYRNCDTSDISWKDEYKTQGCTAIETIIATKTYLEEVRLQQLTDLSSCRNLTESEQKELRVVKNLIKQCNGWEQEEIEFCSE